MVSGWFQRTPIGRHNLLHVVLCQCTLLLCKIFCNGRGFRRVPERAIEASSMALRATRSVTTLEGLWANETLVRGGGGLGDFRVVF